LRVFVNLQQIVPIKYFYHIRKSRLAVNKPKDKKFLRKHFFAKEAAAISSFSYTEIFTHLQKSEILLQKSK